MTVSPTLAREPAANRRWRWLAPLLVVLGLAVLIMMPGFLAQRGGGDDDAYPVIQGAPSTLELSAPIS
jgi:hypothetical protein